MKKFQQGWQQGEEQKIRSKITSYVYACVYHQHIVAHTEYLVTFCGTGVKPKPRLSDITSATAPKEVTPSGTVIFSLIHVLSLSEMTQKNRIYSVSFDPNMGLQ